MVSLTVCPIITDVHQIERKNVFQEEHEPVIIPASFETRKATKPATSSEVVSRPIGDSIDANAASSLLSHHQRQLNPELPQMAKIYLVGEMLDDSSPDIIH